MRLLLTACLGHQPSGWKHAPWGTKTIKSSVISPWIWTWQEQGNFTDFERGRSGATMYEDRKNNGQNAGADKQRYLDHSYHSQQRVCKHYNPPPLTAMQCFKEEGPSALANQGGSLKKWWKFISLISQCQNVHANQCCFHLTGKWLTYL